MATAAPSAAKRWTMPRPIPWPPPVTRATRSFKRTGLILSVDGVEERVERFGECGMGEDAIAERSVRELAQHGDLEHGHDFAAFEAQDGAAQDLAGLGVEDGLHEAAHLGHLAGAGRVLHVHAGDLDRPAAGARFT